MALALYDSYSSLSENDDKDDSRYYDESTSLNASSSLSTEDFFFSSASSKKFQFAIYKIKKNRESIKHNIILLVAVILTVITASANNILFYKISLPFQNYPFFLVLYSSAFSVPFYWLLVLIIIMVPRWKHLIPREMMSFALWKFAVLGLLDSTQGILQFFADSHVPGAMQQLLQQAVIPITMAASIVTLKTKYSVGQYVGAAIIILAIVIDVLPSFISYGDDGGATTPVDSSELGFLFWIAIFLFSSIPFALSYLYKEIIFKNVNMNLFYLMAMDSNFQLLFNVLLTPVDAIPKFGTSTNGLIGVYQNLYQGCLCMFGINSNAGDACAGSIYLLLEYAFFNICINLLLLYLLQQESTAFMFLAMTLSVPVANICFSFPIIMGDYATPLSWSDVVALVVIIAGLLLYRFTTNKPKK